MEAVLLALVVAAAVFDILYRRIPNWLTVSGVVIGLALNTFLYPVWPGLRFSLVGLGAAFLVNLVLFALHARGGGDVKLMSAIGAMAGWENWLGIFAVAAILGGLMALLMTAARGRVKSTLWNVGFILSEMMKGRPAYLRKEELDVKSAKAFRLPAGFVIALGTVFFLVLAARFAR